MIKLVNIHKIYAGHDTGFLALKDINLDFKGDKFVSILGKSGSGKTTLLNIMGGLDKASSGHMVIDGVLTTKYTDTQWDYFRNHKIGFIFQNYSLIEHLSVLDNVMIASKLQGTRTEEAKEKALTLLEEVGIRDQAKKYPKQLSGGQRQRVSVARALINNPDVILADEPTGSLDKKTTKEVMELIKRISDNKLIIMVTHSKKLANQYSDRIIELKDGEVIADTKPHASEKVKIVKTKPLPTKFNFKDKISHSFKNIMTKKWRSFLIALGLSIGITGYILINGISHGVKTNFENQMHAYSTTPNLTFNLNAADVDDTFDPTSIADDLATDADIKAVRFNKNFYLNAVKLGDFELDNSPRELLTYKFTKLDSEQLRYFGRLYGDGKWATADNEIVISTSYAESLYDYNSLSALWKKLKGEQIEIATEYYYQMPFIEENLLPDACAQYTYIDDETVPTDYDTTLFGDYSSQIARQRSLFNGLIFNFQDTSKIYICNDYEVFDLYPSQEIKSTKTFTIVGINELQTIDYSIITEEAYLSLQTTLRSKTNEIYERAEYYQFDVYLENDIKDDPFDLKLKYKDTYLIEDVVDFSSVIALPIIKILVGIVEFIISMIMFVSVITAGIMLLMVLFITVIERSREIGILRSLGATKGDILAIFTVESGIIGFFAGIIGNLLAFALAFGGNKFIQYKYGMDLEKIFNESNINLIMVKPTSGLIAIPISILLAMLFGFIPAIFASKKTPIDALKRT